ncbi:MAG: type III polyketide synthase [Alphaproteobacteria bacterium]|nr:type III polyketide synthase [Alphaproteobacteria bacterium]
MMSRLLALATAVPDHVLDQQAVAVSAGHLFAGRTGAFARLAQIYGNAGIEKRHSCVPLDWYLAPHGWAERSRLYVDAALGLAERTIRDCLAECGLGLMDVDGLVVVSTTGIATPSLDALLQERLGLRRDLQRLPIFGFGCAGGVLGLARAAALARAEPGARILCVVVELCGLTFRAADTSAANIVATALFGDGAAAAMISTDGDGPALGPWGEHSFPDSLDVMGWDIGEDGFGVRFSRDIPTLIRRDLVPPLDAFLARHGLDLARFDAIACHPGGAKVLDALEEILGRTLPEARTVLREFGNMSAPTVLFVLDRLRPAWEGRVLMTALGPGFTAGFLTLGAA